MAASDVISVIRKRLKNGYFVLKPDIQIQADITNLGDKMAMQARVKTIIAPAGISSIADKSKPSP
jgi:hypothetical protein